MTVIDTEFMAVQRLFGLFTKLPGSNYWVEQLAENHEYEVVLSKCSDPTNLPAQDATRDMIEHFKPSFIFLIGIAGGLPNKGVAPGDVIVVNYVDYYGYMKHSGGKSEIRKVPFDQPAEWVRQQFSDPLRMTSAWRDLLEGATVRPEPGSPKALVGNLITGDSLLGDKDQAYQQMLLTKFPNAIAVDMESYGFSRGTFVSRRDPNYNPQPAIIRAVSDMVDSEENQTDRNLWREYAATSAAAFARVVVQELLQFSD